MITGNIIVHGIGSLCAQSDKITGTGCDGSEADGAPMLLQCGYQLGVVDYVHAREGHAEGVNGHPVCISVLVVSMNTSSFSIAVYSVTDLPQSDVVTGLLSDHPNQRGNKGNSGYDCGWLFRILSNVKQKAQKHIDAEYATADESRRRRVECHLFAVGTATGRSREQENCRIES